MTTSRLATLFVLLLATFSSVFFLPKRFDQPQGIVLNLPEYLGVWWGKQVDVTTKEREVLGEGTEFARRFYSDGAVENVLASIVLSGSDMMTSIHRPERCLVAQGWTPGASETRMLDIPGYGKVSVTRLHNSKRVRVGEDFVKVDSVCYYWFVGYTRTAATHEERVRLDFTDRILRGYDQRWAMVMISSEVTKLRSRFGKDENETSEMLEDFVKKLIPQIHQDSVSRG